MSDNSATQEEVLRTAGNLMQNAAVNEQIMCMAFKIFSQCSTKMAYIVFYTPDSLQVKKVMLNRVLDAADHDEEDKELVQRIIRAAEKSNNQRKELAHTLLVFKTETLDSAFDIYTRSLEKLSLQKKITWIIYNANQSTHLMMGGRHFKSYLRSMEYLRY